MNPVIMPGYGPLDGLRTPTDHLPRRRLRGTSLRSRLVSEALRHSPKGWPAASGKEGPRARVLGEGRSARSRRVLAVARPARRPRLRRTARRWHVEGAPLLTAAQWSRVGGRAGCRPHVPQRGLHLRRRGNLPAPSLRESGPHGAARSWGERPPLPSRPSGDALRPRPPTVGGQPSGHSRATTMQGVQP